MSILQKVLFASLILTFISCKKDNPRIEGTWICSGGYTEDCGEFSDSFDTNCDGYQVNFLSDGTYTTRFETDDNVYQDGGTFVIADNFLIIDLETGQEITDRFILTSDELQIINEQGQGCKLIWVYIRE